MAVEIEILALTRDEATVALYYDVAALPGAVDANRAPRGQQVQQVGHEAELQAIKDGTRIEFVKALKIAGLSKAQKRALVEGAHAAHRAEATAAHAARHADSDLVGRWFDGTAWS